MDMSKHPGRPAGPTVPEEAMDRDTLETLCQSFAARHSAAPAGIDPVPEIMRSFRLAEISAAEMHSLLGLVSDDDESADAEGLSGFEGDLDPPTAIVDDFPDFDEIVAAGYVEDDDGTAGAADDDAAIIVRIAPFLRGAAVERRDAPRG